MATKDNTFLLIRRVLKLYGISVSDKGIAKTILTHPDFPSMQCISDAFTNWKIKHVVLRLTLNKLRKLGIPVIAHLKKGEFIWVEQVSDDQVRYWSATKGNRTMPGQEFEKTWSGIVLAIEDIEGAGELDYKANHRKEIQQKIVDSLIKVAIILLCSLLLFFAWRIDAQPLWCKLFLLLINGGGLYISYVLIRREKHQSGRIADKFCKKGKHIDCDKVTSSQYSKLFGIVSWAELGAAYFITVLLWSTIAPMWPAWFTALWWFVLAALPFTIWSVLVQGAFIHKWCLFCCTVAILLCCNAVVMYAVSPDLPYFNVQGIALLLLIFLFCIISVTYWNQTNGWQSELYAEQRRTTQFKYNLKTLKAQWSETVYPVKNTGFAWNDVTHTSFEVALYVSANCQHCGKAVKEFALLPDIYPELSFRLIVAADTDMPAEFNDMIQYIINAYLQLEKHHFFEMLHTWYKVPEKKLEKIQNDYPVMILQDNAMFDALCTFNRQIAINYTPAILINGHLLSNLYNYSDLAAIARTLNHETV